MPIERRHIVFRPAEYIDAIRDYRRRCGSPLPPDRVLRSELGGEDELHATLTLASREGAESQIAIPQHELVAALVFHCINHRIPLPSKTPKGLKRYAESLALTLDLEIAPA